MSSFKVNKGVAKDIKINNIKNTNIEDIEVVSSTEDIEFDEVNNPIDTKLVDSDITNDDTDSSDNKNKIKIMLLGGLVILVISIGVVFILSSKGVKDEDMMPIGGLDVEDNLVLSDPSPNIESDTEDLNEIKEEVDTDISISDDVTTTNDKVVYENTLLGLALKYPSNWYVDERADVLLNMVQSTNAVGEINLLTNEVKLAGYIVDFSTRDDLGTKVSLGISPLVLSGDTQLADINSLSDILNVGTASQIDEQIKTNIASGGGTLLESTPSTVKDISSYKVVQSKYVFEKNGIKMDVVQMLIPYGVNNIVLTCTSKVGDSSINKEEVLITMLGSIGKVGDVTLNEDVKGSEEATDVKTNDSTPNKEGVE